MQMLRISLMFLCTGLIAVQAAESINQTIIGTNPLLSAGANALRIGDFEEGVSLTLDGLDASMTPRQRAIAFSNVCAGYIGLRQFAKALETCDKALDLNDRNWRIYNNRALALLNAGRIVAAREDIKKGFALNPGSSTLAKVANLIKARARNRVVAKDRVIEVH
ncbi:MAG: tetratricopeptide repeat protein [Gammaproteobacteria bacterium]|jgi:tetratricopeptide (TPR) repeat protein|nr:hypothetical protein [Chromatiales bacterium]MDP7297355.1 tetratricopeptide repeat protein [Gammaproteobacteria bacterium]